MKFAIKKVAGKAVAVGSGVVGLVGVAMADVPAEVTGAMTSMKADALTVATGFLVAFIAVSAFLYMRKGAK